ncbi:PI-PLC X domain-containing protein 1-like [Cynocephalus volans]|uniref:PI-PLC X domain-containing protein 1-like n=1 Tax=Cynocephalus volans TaxID=110931 RepID=UPI002FC5C8D6
MASPCCPRFSPLPAGPAEWGLPSRLPTSFSVRGLVLKCNVEQERETGNGRSGVSFKGAHNQWVQDTLTEISVWLEKHPREVVPLACRNFQGLSTDLHKYLVTCIQNIFGDMLCPRGKICPFPEVPTLHLLWARSQKVIIFYEVEDTVSQHRELSPGVCYWWGNKVKVQELIRYLEGMKSCSRPGGLFVAGINLTENLEYILVHPCESLQKMTVPEVPYLSTWVRAQCPGPGSRCTNVIAGDFIGTDSFVSDVIRLNEKLLWC